jgi:hypothetical protein
MPPAPPLLVSLPPIPVVTLDPPIPVVSLDPPIPVVSLDPLVVVLDPPPAPDVSLPVPVTPVPVVEVTLPVEAPAGLDKPVLPSLQATPASTKHPRIEVVKGLICVSIFLKGDQREKNDVSKLPLQTRSNTQHRPGLGSR